MAHTYRKFGSLNLHGFRSGLTAKIACALAICLTVRVLLAQPPAAPAASAASVREEVDARGYKVQIPSEAYTDPKNRAKLQSFKNSGLRTIVSGQPSQINDAGTRATVDRFFQQYFFPMMTTEEGLKTIADDRNFFLRQYVQSAKDTAAHTYLINTALTSASKIVQDNYHPAARYNAMLLISSLNDQELNTQGAAQTLPEPMRAALPFILQQFQKADNPDVVKLAALLGLSRHLEFDNYRPAATAMPADRKAEIIKSLTELVETKEPAEGRSSEAHTWIRRRAIEALSMACLAKPDPGIAATLDSLLKDESEPLSIRLTVASLMGKIALQAPAKIEAVPTAKELGYLALYACDTELTRADSSRKTEAEHEARLAGTYTGETGYGPGGGMMPGVGMPGVGMPGGEGSGGGVIRRPAPGSMPGTGSADGYGGYGESGYVDPSMMDPKHYRLEYLRRRMRQQLYAVQLGLTGGDDRVPPRPGVKSSGAAGKADRQEPTKGVWVIAKPGQEREAVDEVYYKVRKVIEAIEGATPETDFNQLAKDIRKEMKPLEAITRRLPPPGATPGATTVADDDAPGAPAAGKAPIAKAKGGKPASGKVPAAKAPAPPAAKKPAATGKSASRPPARPQTVFGQPRFGR
jgi:hypothetical protein